MPILVPVVRDAAREHYDAGFWPGSQAIAVTYKMLTVPDSYVRLTRRTHWAQGTFQRLCRIYERTTQLSGSRWPVLRRRDPGHWQKGAIAPVVRPLATREGKASRAELERHLRGNAVRRQAASGGGTDDLR